LRIEGREAGEARGRPRFSPSLPLLLFFSPPLLTLTALIAQSSGEQSLRLRNPPAILDSREDFVVVGVISMR